MTTRSLEDSEIKAIFERMDGCNAERNKPIRIGDDIQKAIADFTEWKAEVEKGLRFTIVTINDKTRLI